MKSNSNRINELEEEIYEISKISPIGDYEEKYVKMRMNSLQLIREIRILNNYIREIQSSN